VPICLIGTVLGYMVLFAYSENNTNQSIYLCSVNCHICEFSNDPGMCGFSDALAIHWQMKSQNIFTDAEIMREV
jgi:hypothetical protein